MSTTNKTSRQSTKASTVSNTTNVSLNQEPATLVDNVSNKKKRAPKQLKPVVNTGSSLGNTETSTTEPSSGSVQENTNTNTNSEPLVNEVVTTSEVVVDPPSINEHVEMYTKLNQVISIVSGLKKELKAMEVKYARDLKLAQKQNNKKKKRSGTRNPSGFVKPTRISDELAAFLGKETGCEMARTSVTRELNNYIVLHELKDAKNGRQINADSKLSALLKLQEGDVLTFFNLQKYMSPHFPKSLAAIAASQQTTSVQ
jgi:upstream activation factor subunit UAF30